MPASAEPHAAPAGTSRGDWQEAFRLLDVGLELDPAAHAGWLATLAPESARLSPLLEQLLRSHVERSTADFMQTPATFALAAEAPAAPPDADTLVGPYRLLREIGEGGMATVWLAERADGLLDRRVALKLPHAAWSGASFADRMARERNILASLAHPNIARLYDAGIAADGRPYLAMEYVDGQPIGDFASGRELGVAQRVALVVQVARAVAHAHARLVVHRDLKPSNILVDAQGQAHLLDFGIAKLLDVDVAPGDDATQLTQMPGRALTPDYASPEQIRGDPIGTASDIYSLGVVLFEVLTGERPYRLKRGLGAAALAEAIEAVQVPRPSSAAGAAAISRQLRGDLDSIVGRALAKASGERYVTVDALADDLERHLRGEPVHARPDSAWYRAERWVRRHKLETLVALAIVVAVPAGAAAQVAVLAAIAVGAGVALWQARVARRQAKIAGEEAARAAAVKAFLTSFFKSGSLDEDGGAQLGRLSVQQFVERGARKIDASFEHEPELKTELLDVVSTLFADLSDGARTVEYAMKWRRTLDAFGASEVERARASQRLALGLGLLGRNAEAATMLAEAASRLQARANAPTLLAHLRIDLARLHQELGETPRALEGVAEALTLLGSEGQGKATTGAHAEALFLRAELTAIGNRLVEAVPLFEQAIADLVRLHGERSAVVGRHRFIYATALNAGRQLAEGVQQLREALRIFQEAGGGDDLNAAIVELHLGRMMSWVTESRAEGLALLAHARDVLVARADSVSVLYPALAQLYLAEALIDEGELEKAREPMEAANELFRDKVESATQRTLTQLIHARYLSECGDYDASDRILEATRAARESLVGADHPLTASVTNRIGLNLSRRQDHAGAQAVFASILGSQDAREDVFGSVKHLARQNLAVAQLDGGDVARALPILQRNFDGYHVAPESARNALSEASLSMSLGRALMADGQPGHALPLLQRNVDILAGYPKSPGLAASRCWLGLCRLALGEEQEARALAELARATLAAQPSAGIHYRRILATLDERLAAVSLNR